MRIGILTFHLGNNYGGILQCYALQQVLLGLGHSVEVINYSNTCQRGFFQKLHAKFSTANSIAGFLHTIFEMVVRHKAFSYDKSLNDASLKEFDKFRECYLNISQPLDASTIGEYANAHYDLVITGSDQVWTSLFDEPLVYMADWKPRFVGKRMSYAACSAYSVIHGKQKNYIRECLNRYDYITVRDKTSQSLVHSITGVAPEVVPDPSLLYGYEEFLTKQPQEPYILTYILGDEIKNGHALALKRIKEAVGNYPVYSIVIPCNNQEIIKYSDKVFETCSPGLWVNMFYHATYVYTDSFHAIMFALKFQKPFTAYYKNIVRSSRLKNLKDMGIASIYEDARSISSVMEVYSENIVKRGFDFNDLMNRVSKNK